MQAQGSFKIPQWAIFLRKDLRGQGHVPKFVRLETKLVFLLALKDYLLEVIDHIPVLTGTTKDAFYQILDQVEDRIQDFYSQYEVEASIGIYAGLEGADISREPLDMTETARQYPTSQSTPRKPDPGKTYKEGAWYRGQRVRSREEWRQAAASHTKAIVGVNYSVTGGGWIQNFNFSVEVHDVKPNYYPVVYETLTAFQEVFLKSLEKYYPEQMNLTLGVFVGEGKNG